jgi:hypothetical protein
MEYESEAQYEIRASANSEHHSELFNQYCISVCVYLPTAAVAELTASPVISVGMLLLTMIYG